MEEDNKRNQRQRLNEETLDSQSFKEIEKFSHEVCLRLTSTHGTQSVDTANVYGLAAFLATVLQAIRRCSSPQTTSDEREQIAK